jgi:hypothetical protein
MKKVFVLIPVILLFAGCGASIDPILQGRINAYFAQKSSDTFAPAGKFQHPMQFSVGQWVMYAHTYNGKRSVSKMSIVGQEGKGWIIENYSLTESNETTVQMLVTGLDKYSETYKPEDIDIVWVKMKKKGSDEIQKLEGPMLSLSKSMYRNGMLNYGLKLSALGDGGDVSILAGAFMKTTKATSQVEISGNKYVSDVWFYQDVPINGMIKSVRTDGSATTELISFGKTGARSGF